MGKLWPMSRAQRARYDLWLRHSEATLRLTEGYAKKLTLLREAYKQELVKVNARYPDEK